MSHGGLRPTYLLCNIYPNRLFQGEEEEEEEEMEEAGDGRSNVVLAEGCRLDETEEHAGDTVGAGGGLMTMTMTMGAHGLTAVVMVTF